MFIDVHFGWKYNMEYMEVISVSKKTEVVAFSDKKKSLLKCCQSRLPKFPQLI